MLLCSEKFEINIFENVQMFSNIMFIYIIQNCHLRIQWNFIKKIPIRLLKSNAQKYRTSFCCHWGMKLTRIDFKQYCFEWSTRANTDIFTERISDSFGDNLLQPVTAMKPKIQFLR